MKRFLKRLVTFLLSLFFIFCVGLTLYLSAFKDKSEPTIITDDSKEAKEQAVNGFEIIFENAPNTQNKTTTDEDTSQSVFLFDIQTGTITGYVGSEPTVNIPSFIDGIAVKHIGAAAFESSSLSSVTMSEGIQDIASDAFRNCRQLTDVSLANSVKILGTNVFYDCTALEEITFSDHLGNIGDYCFYACSSLKSITLPASLNTIGNYAFAENTLLETAYFKGNAPKNWGTAVFLNTKPHFTIYYLSENNGFTTALFHEYNTVCIYEVTAEKADNGIITPNSKKVPAGSSVTFTVNPASGKRVVAAYYTDKDGQHAIKNNHFVMPDSDVTISAVYGWSVLYVLLTLSIVLSLLGFSLWFLFRQK